MPHAAAALIEGLVDDHPADTARVLERFPLADRAAFVRELPPGRAAPVLASMTADAAASVLSLLDPDAAAALLGRLRQRSMSSNQLRHLAATVTGRPTARTAS